MAATDPSDKALKLVDTGLAGEFQPELHTHVRQGTEFVRADGAGDGHLALQSLIDDGDLYNVVARHYDQAHGGRRITLRPWQADMQTKEVIEVIIFGDSSITKLLQHSSQFQQWLAANDLTSEQCDAKVTALACGLKTHRYDSTTVPLARHVLRHGAIVKTAIQIQMARRGSKEATVAAYFLLFISGRNGLQRCLILAMCADAADEAMYVIRHSDKDRPNSAETAFVIAKFARHIQTLFLERKCLDTGYTKVMIDTLKRPLIYTVEGKPLQCGSAQGIPEESLP